jgi:hypothetical protein
LVTRKNGLFKRLAFTPDDPDEFVRVCKSIIPGHSLTDEREVGLAA